jgi:hypothetical protein
MQPTSELMLALFQKRVNAVIEALVEAAATIPKEDYAAYSAGVDRVLASVDVDLEKRMRSLEKV